MFGLLMGIDPENESKLLRFDVIIQKCLSLRVKMLYYALFLLYFISQLIKYFVVIYGYITEF